MFFKAEVRIKSNNRSLRVVEEGRRVPATFMEVGETEFLGEQVCR